ncbi:helix-turn-helix domain-containing protein [Streptomyces albidoflavus]|uniref:helix-turn-helix domain-containing protein n=1 Tax=Streptomyces albidoflavus TaxID=1886 RepID=UPI00101E58B5|nr:helix-turn-helix domain-containing protein [Streptomyces albidoflavus]RZD89310.1 helix-turn-helix domain-containing protein [Streptomyces albidoflavus]RZE04969.1 helix-turn-helix domain-containing protein [Streptomyces albidoflavus]
MSREARDWVWDHSSAKNTARLVMLSIAERVGDEQYVSWASLSSLAARTKASVSTVREAILHLIRSGELERLDDLVGPKGSTVYRLPLAAKAAATTDEGGEGETTLVAIPPLRLSALRRFKIRPRGVPELPMGDRESAVPETGRSRREPAPRHAGFRHSDVPESGTQNRSEPDVNRKYSSGAAVLPASEWTVDPATRTWVRQQGHLDRLGEQGLQAADAKWRAHRAALKPRPAPAWAADWRSWVAREHPTTSAAARGNATAPAGMTRAEAHTAALLAALDEPAGTER